MYPLLWFPIREVSLVEPTLGRGPWGQVDYQRETNPMEAAHAHEWSASSAERERETETERQSTRDVYLAQDKKQYECRHKIPLKTRCAISPIYDPLWVTHYDP